MLRRRRAANQRQQELPVVEPGRALILTDPYHQQQQQQQPNITFSEPMTIDDENNTGGGAAGASAQQDFPHEHQEVTVVGYLVIAGFLLVFSLVLLLLLAKYLQRRRRLHDNGRNRDGRHQPYHPTRRATKIRIQRRYETVEHWIISKQAVPHDDFCDVVVSNFGHHKQQQQKLKPQHAPKEASRKSKKKKSNSNSSSSGSGSGRMEDPVGADAYNRNKSGSNRGGQSSIANAAAHEEGEGVEACCAANGSSSTMLAHPSPIPDEEAMECPSSSASVEADSDAVEITKTRTSSASQEEQNPIQQLPLVPRSSSASSSTPSSSCEQAVTDNDNESSRCRPAAAAGADNVRECPICMGELQAGQIVSWSANEQCTHVYHHECIKEWLLRHIECCLCKNIYLPVDEKKGRAKTDALRELSHRFAAASATSYFCVETGLVRIPRSVRCTRSELQRLEQRIFDGAIPPARLVALRGSRQEFSNAGNANVVEGDDMQLEIIGGDDSSNSNLLNTTMDTSATEQSFLEDATEDVVSNNTSSGDNHACDGEQQRQQQQQQDDVEESSSSLTEVSAAATTQLNDSFPCSSATLQLCPYGTTASQRDVIDSSSSLSAVSSEVIEEGTAGNSSSNSSSIATWRAIVPQRRSSSAPQSIMRPRSDRSDGSGELVAASEYLEQNKASVVGDNRCRIIDSFDEADGVEVAATTHQTLMDVEDILHLSTTSSNRSDDSSVEDP